MNWKTRLFTILSTVFSDTKTFTLTEVYQTCQGVMSYYYPDNTTIQATICRNLEDFRDMGIITFVDNRGTYCWVIDNN